MDGGCSVNGMFYLKNFIFKERVEWLDFSPSWYLR